MDKRTIFAFVLIALIVIFWDDYLKLIGYAPQPAAVDTTSIVADSEIPPPPPVQSTRIRSSSEPVLDVYPSGASELTGTETRVDDLWSAGQDLPERLITVETSIYRAVFTTHGAGLVSFALKPSRHYLKKDIELIPEGGQPRPAARFWTYDGPIDTDKMKFQLNDDFTESDRKIMVKPGQETTLEFIAPIGDQWEFRVIYTFKGGDYSFLYAIETVGLSDFWVRPDADLFWRGGLAFTEPNPKQEITYSQAFSYFAGDILEDLKQNVKKDVFEGPATGETRWVAIRNKYFMTALIPETAPATGAWMESLQDSLKEFEDHPNFLGVGLKIPLMAGSPATPVRVFLGPLDDEILSEIDPSLKKAMTWGAGFSFVDGIIKPISRIVLWGLKGLHGFIPNYGICIIIFSVLVKIILWPLTRKSYQSMAAMGALKPEMDALRVKYKNDPQKLNKEIMGLYKLNKVNPMGGCLPMLLQMPVLFALFVVFRSTIEFRRAPFIFWINDLSLPDKIFDLPFNLPLYGAHVAVLPIVMGITSFLQSKSTVTDPNQKFMIYFMPVFMTLIFNQFPSGLTLYYTLFNVWTLLQQKITPPPRPVVAEANGNAKKR